MRKDRQGSFQYTIIPALTFLRKTDATEIQADASYGAQVYSNINRQALSQDVQKYGLRGLYKTERFDWGLSSSYSVIPTRNTAVQDSGVFNINSSNTTWSISPSVTYNFDEINSIILTPTYSETTFGNTSIANPGNNNAFFRNNNSTNVNLAWQRLWTDRYSSTVSLFYSNFSAQGNTGNGGGDTSSTFDTTGINVSNAYSWSEKWNFTGTVGVRHTESSSSGGLSSNNPSSSSSFGFLADIGANYTGESLSSAINFSRSLTPSNQGQLQELTGVNLNFNYKIYERLSASFNTGYQKSTLVAATSTRRENITVQPSLNWLLSPEWTLIGSYRYRTQEGTLNTISADSNLFMLSINYNWQGLKLSR